MFYATFKKSAIASIWHRATKYSKESLGCLKGVVPSKAQIGCGQALS